jgi:ceramide glucosyltransferase
MAHTLSLLLYGLAAVGLAVLIVQLVATARHVAGRDPARPERAPGISILKPLCGDDDELAANLEAFATLSYPACELLLGVEHVLDRAYPVAVAAAARWPERVRVVVQRGAPSLNPKVSQLLTLASEARHEIVVVSDSNIRPPAGYLDGIAGHLADPSVGLVTHAIVGGGGGGGGVGGGGGGGGGAVRLGSVLDGLHLSAAVAPGVIAAKRVAGRDVVVGKSMALRAADLAALGGFAAVKDVLAEDYVLGLLVPARLGKRVVVACTPVTQITCRRSVGDFWRRSLRWQVIHRRAVSRAAYAGELVLNPVALALLAALLGPPAPALAVIVAKGLIDAAAARLTCGAPLAARGLAAGPLKDAILGCAWLGGLLLDSVCWRGHRLRVLEGTRLELPAPDAVLPVMR